MELEKEDKELLLKDLCARLPYKVKCERYGKAYELDEIDINRSLVYVFRDDWCTPTSLPYRIGCDDIKPYLRSMSSMTEEEVKELVKLQIGKYSSSSEYNNIISIDRISMMRDRKSWSADLHFKTESGYKCQTCLVGWVNWETTLSEIDWLNSHHFDYRGLIEKGLALEAPKDIY